MNSLVTILLGLLLVGCETVTPRPTMEVRHLQWSNKVLVSDTSTHHATATMNEHGLLKLHVDGATVAYRENWCVEVVEYE